MLLITIYALIGDDIRILAFDKSHDDTFLWLNVASLTFFITELLFSSIGVKGYFGSFFFWLDLLSTVSVVTDIEPLWIFIISLGDDRLTDFKFENLRSEQGLPTN